MSLKEVEKHLDKEIVLTLHLPMTLREYFDMYRRYLALKHEHKSFNEFIWDALQYGATRFRW